MEKENVMAHSPKHTLQSLPQAQDILQAWLPFKQLMGVTSVHTPEDYAQAQVTMEALLDAVGDDENHPLAEVLDYLADQLKTYEDEQVHIPQAEPKEVLRLLMDQHQLKQQDLSDCAPQGRISDILNGKRAISKDMAKRLAARFHVRADLFL
jgi:HTH-type transcriptional regulator / antitoxin HigA